MGGRILRWACAALVVAALPVAVALATAPNKGSVYFGQTSKATDVSFEVSADGTHVRMFDTGVVAPICGPAPGAPKYPASVKISKGSFTLKELLPVGSKNSTTVIGHFEADGKVKGTIRGKIQCLLPPNFNSGPVKHFSQTWSANSEPDGKASRSCYDYVKPTGKFSGIDLTSIVTFGVPCKTVDAALHAGTFATTAPHDFTTPGWTCTALGGGLPRFSCSKRHHKFNFTRFD